MPDIWASADEQDILRVHPLSQDIQVDYVGGTNPIYVGWALPGSETADTRWRLVKITWDGNNNPTSVRFAGGTNKYDKTWDDRTTYTYLSP